ncbi:1163_t:CDS:10 [Acaulospora morrowiae]|uniref:1163_t:CDS:1 n=1 Tax=Acaulospora morrowiae TaxID=94023 RepID=A0A9N9AKH2_9GLOM|nr:1163_t:CDS:10 [Acaulospora morrowiae]
MRRVPILSLSSSYRARFGYFKGDFCIGKGFKHYSDVACKIQQSVEGLTCEGTRQQSQSTLRPYQQECIETCLRKFLEDKVKRQIVSLPVGSGKTVIFSNLIRNIPPPYPGADKVLVLAHREELLDQAYRQISKFSPDLTLEIDQGERNAIGNANVIIGSVQTLGRTDSDRIKKYDPSNFKAIIIDEAHHAPANTYRRILEYFGATNKDTHMFIWGCSATVRRNDGVALGEIFDEISYHRDFLDMINEKWLCNLRVTTVKTDFDLSNVKSNNADFIESDLSKYVNVRPRNEMIARTYLALAESRKSTLVFGVDIKHVEALKETFQEFGITASSITSKTKKHLRSEILNDFKSMKFPVLVNCGIFTEGADIPNIDCIIMSRPTKSPVLFQQMIGRGMRLAEGKEDCLVLDFIDSYVHFPDLVTVPSLLGLKSDTEMKDQDIQRIPSEPSEPKLELQYEFPNIEKIKITEYDNPVELIEACSGALNIRRISRFSWIKIGDDSYVLPLLYVGNLRVEKENDGLYRVRLRKREIKMIKNKPIPMTFFVSLPITHDSLESVIRSCDHWVERQDKNVVSPALWHAKWRKEQITDRQMKFLKKKISLDDQVLKKLNRGQAANLMAKMIEGADKNRKKSFEKEAEK